MKIIIVGATGLVGKTIASILEERQFPITDIKFLASPRSAGKKILFNQKEHTIQKLTENEFANYDLAFFAAGGSISEKYVPIAIQQGVRVIDNSSFFRMNPNVPLVVPEVNKHVLTEETMLVANPNCSTIQCMPPLAQVQKNFGLKRIIYSTYQSVSGSGTMAIKDLEDGTSNFYPYQIRANLIPQIDDFLDNGYSKEEMKMINESRKILEQDSLGVTATTVRVPVFYAHSISVNLETEKEFDIEVVKGLLAQAEGIELIQDDSHLKYPMPLDSEGKDNIFVGRLRRDESIEKGLNLWIVADNIRKGAALNSVQIAEELIKKVKL